ncbi:hypothetical protein TRAPUB_5394 [Trametes pubescens]|uniref:Hydrophobin n=1 Tax=Trametes pubescens TaxID=154538 RepID=A0A1M2V8N0_TRAPU|nr:hypothetical protein TRAPUB_5394 [Trametes pubescens]
MHLVALTSLALVLVLAHLDVVTGIPAGHGLQRSAAECSFVCQTDAQCADCPGAASGVASILQYTCVTLDIPGLDGVRPSVDSEHRDGPAYPALSGVSPVVGRRT